MKKILTILLIILFPITVSAQHVKTYHVKKYRKHAKGFKHDTNSKFKAFSPHVNFLSDSTPIPAKVDLSPLVSLPEDQGQCGACWDFSLTKALRSEYMIAGKDPGVLEFNYLLNNCGPGPQMGGCHGGSFAAAASFQGSFGPGLNSLNPYVGVSNGQCAGLPVQATALSYSMLGEGGNAPTFKDIAYVVGVGHHMVSIDVAAGAGEWESYASGIYNGCTGGVNDVDHMIDAVGYDCETSIDAHSSCVFDVNGRPANGDGYLLVENNWNETWGVQAGNGHGGYMKTRMYGEDGTHCNAIASNALIFTLSAPPLDPAPIPQVTHKSWFCKLLGC